jgi:hypothetical protein
MLPTIEQPTYEIKLISSDKPVHYRPWLVKEQKIMMMAAEAKEIETTLRAIKQVIKNCVVDPIKVDELPLADLETLFINLRAKSMGEVMQLYFKCTNQVPDTNPQMMSSLGYAYKECGMIIEVPVNLLEVKQVNNNIPKKIMLSDKIGVIMKYPSLDMVDKLAAANDSSAIFTIVASCIEQIFDEKGVYKTKDATQEEIYTFVENMRQDAFEKLTEFVDNVPKSRYETKKKCPKCGYDHDFVLEGISDFFT